MVTSHWGRALLLFSLVVAASAALALEEPALPAGLDEEPPLPAGLGDEEPALPAGLDETEPALPEGLGEKPAEPSAPAGSQRKESRLLDELRGFWEVRGGVRTQHDPHQRQASLGETRLQLDWEKPLQEVTLKLTADLLYDAVLDRHRVDLEEGRGFLDLRQANVTFSPLESVDVKVGRQILTWGTGDLLFLNDLFPKDWQAFFIGRDLEYLKAPSDAVRLSVFAEPINVEVVFTPRFDADRYITGERLSFFNTALGRQSGRDAVIDAQVPHEWFTDHETALRAFRTIDGYELAAYAYHGFWKSPAGMDPLTGRPTFPDLVVWGGSARGPLGPGIGNLEVAYYDSLDDEGGGNPFVRNSELRLLAGFARDLPRIARDLNLGAQYYLERMMNHGDYLRSLPAGSPAADACRHVLTLRLTKLLLEQNLALSLFAFYSPSDNDAYLRPNAQYKIDDHWTVEAGGNVFLGSNQRSFFAQFADNTNVYASLRYGF